jgi:hypothetical protein
VTAVDADRWVEVDLYWFDKRDVRRSARAFWERFAPLMRDVAGWRGLIVNTGFLVDFVLDWRGSLADRVPVPANLTKDKFFPADRPLLGSVEERKAQWRQRFSRHAARAGGDDARWTYAELKDLADALRGVAAEEFGLEGLRVGTLVLGWESIYDCDRSRWAKRHPEGFVHLGWQSRAFNVVAALSADDVAYGAFPSGIEAGTPLGSFFGAQWGHLSRRVGLDAILLRDSMIGPGIYDRVGPYGSRAPDAPEELAAWSEATALLIRETKLANPGALVMGYSNAASAVADWRVNCVDLEKIAREGHLDAWIDQTWAGAWNEVGQRENTFWNAPTLGWSYQLANVLLHAAVLAETGVRHYTLTETFDAWESWDVIHTARERLRWGIWAYLHAFVKTPGGLKAPAGTYVSWANQGGRLLSPDDVDFITRELNAAVLDARSTHDVLGPTLVYSRSAMQGQNDLAPARDIKEWIDEQAGSLMKWSVPISSATRCEYLGQVHSDLFVVQTPVHLTDRERESVARLIDSGAPVAIFGSPAGGIDPAFARRAGLASSDAEVGGLRLAGRVVDATAAERDSLPLEFRVVHGWCASSAAPDARVLYEVAGSPCLTVRGTILVWDPPEFDRRFISDPELVVDPDALRAEFWKADISMSERLGSPVAYVLTARAFAGLLRRGGALWADGVRADRPVQLAAWRLEDGSLRLLAADLEEGFRDSTDGTAEIRVMRGDEPLADLRLGYAQSTLLTNPTPTGGDPGPRWQR